MRVGDDRGRRVETDGGDTREASLRALHGTARELMVAESADEVLATGLRAARDVLGYETSSIHRYDSDRDALVPAVATDRAEMILGEPPTFHAGDSIAWRAFETREVVVCEDVRDDPDVRNAETPFRAELFCPLGDRGLLLAASTDRAVFGERDRSLGRVLAADIRSALQRVDREERLRQREAALTRQNERLNEFAATLTHDLRTPLDLAGAHLEMATDGDEPGEHLEAVAAAHSRIAELIDDVLTWAREGDAVEACEPVSLPALVSECWADRERTDLTLDIATDRTVRADRGRLRQLFENLLDNAVAHASETATVTVGELDDSNGIYVADDGPGIPAAERSAVFDAGHTLGSESTGFGLAIVEQIVDAHGWSIAVTESAAGGARFEIRF